MQSTRKARRVEFGVPVHYSTRYGIKSRFAFRNTLPWKGNPAPCDVVGRRNKKRKQRPQSLHPCTDAVGHVFFQLPNSSTTAGTKTPKTWLHSHHESGLVGNDLEHHLISARASSSPQDSLQFYVYDYIYIMPHIAVRTVGLASREASHSGSRQITCHVRATTMTLLILYCNSIILIVGRLAYCTSVIPM